ncbi:hypothetical protein DM02DRAFT_662995 [Periconia macrospinosa]|uniref:Uncharacterized protein n=1 Tax=Periconia macrospinosa TaxID=97972 RepID=A0A2V1D2Y8_9PLEO|nr:hypothetical protein DM02DRAFT_662995 [Periconia macrospinosa]
MEQLPDLYVPPPVFEAYIPYVPRDADELCAIRALEEFLAFKKKRDEILGGIYLPSSFGSENKWWTCVMKNRLKILNKCKVVRVFCSSDVPPEDDRMRELRYVVRFLVGEFKIVLDEFPHCEKGGGFDYTEAHRRLLCRNVEVFKDVYPKPTNILQMKKIMDGISDDEKEKLNELFHVYLEIMMDSLNLYDVPIALFKGMA